MQGLNSCKFDRRQVKIRNIYCRPSRISPVICSLHLSTGGEESWFTAQSLPLPQFDLLVVVYSMNLKYMLCRYQQSYSLSSSSFAAARQTASRRVWPLVLI